MKALILVDIQNDFLPGGALAVPEGDAIIPVVNQLQPFFDLVVATQDWHPANHGSFAANHSGRKPGETVDLNGLPQVLWPVHCVQDTEGARLSPLLETRWIRKVFLKGTDPGLDSYSGFFDNGHRRATGLEEFLKQHRVEEVGIAGLATDYCVNFTARDALRLGFRTEVIEDACRGINLHEGDVSRVLAQLKAAGARVTRSAEMGVPAGRLAGSQR